MTHKNTLDRRAMAGLCRCGAQPDQGKKSCSNCITRMVQSNRERMALRKSQGLCRCGKPVKPGAKKCDACLATHVRWVSAVQKRYRDAGLCSCGKPPAENKESCERCLNRRKALTKRHKANGVCISCQCRPAESGHASCDGCFEKTRVKGREIRARYRKAVMVHYGSRCDCCGESNDAFLTIDHVNNDGKEHRKIVHASKLYRWLMKNNYPAGFQILCWNCNVAKQLHGECPHRKMHTNKSATPPTEPSNPPERTEKCLSTRD